jgi:hypothetical protein
MTVVGDHLIVFVVLVGLKKYAGHVEFLVPLFNPF